MFTKAELLQQHKSINREFLHFLRVEYFNVSTHPHIETESSYGFYRGNTTDFDSAVEFYCNCLIAGGWGDVEIALCSPIAKHEFQSRIKRALHGFADIVQLPQMDDFVAALQMEDEWSDVGVLAKFKNEFIYAHWETSA